jgi:nucleotide-binding universal stress UspA family protein
MELIVSPQGGAMKRILAAVDGSSPSVRGARLAARLAGRFGAELTLVHAVHLDVPSPSGKYKAALAQLWKEHEQEGKRFMQKVADGLRAHGAPIRTALVRGSPAKKIAEVARSGRFDLVVVGSRGRGAVARRLLGSTAERVVRLCEQPVLIVR